MVFIHGWRKCSSLDILLTNTSVKGRNRPFRLDTMLSDSENRNNKYLRLGIAKNYCKGQLILKKIYFKIDNPQCHSKYLGIFVIYESIIYWISDLSYSTRFSRISGSKSGYLVAGYPVNLISGPSLVETDKARTIN